MMAQKLITFAEGNVIIMGHFNLVWNVSLDRMDGPTQHSGTFSRRLKHSFKDMVLHDIWREQHSHDQEFTFFALVYRRYSRIDYILVSSSLIAQIQASHIGRTVLSDHAPISVQLDSFRTGWLELISKTR